MSSSLAPCFLQKRNKAQFFILFYLSSSLVFLCLFELNTGVILQCNPEQAKRRKSAVPSSLCVCIISCLGIIIVTLISFHGKNLNYTQSFSVVNYVFVFCKCREINTFSRHYAELSKWHFYVLPCFKAQMRQW